MIRWNAGLELRLPGLPPILIDVGVPVMALILCGPIWVGATPNELATAALIVPILTLSVMAHELGHALVARRWGMRAVAIRLYATGGVAVLEGQLPSRAADRQITLAGPLANLLLGLALLGIAFLLTPAPLPDRAWSELLPPAPSRCPGRCPGPGGPTSPFWRSI